MFVKNDHFSKQAAVFYNNGVTKVEIAVEEDSAMVMLYNGKQGEQLESLGTWRFHLCVATSKLSDSIWNWRRSFPELLCAEQLNIGLQSATRWEH